MVPKIKLHFDIRLYYLNKIRKKLFEWQLLIGRSTSNSLKFYIFGNIEKNNLKEKVVKQHKKLHKSTYTE